MAVDHERGYSIFEDGEPTAEELEAIRWVLTTTRANRRTLDLERPVPRDVLEQCLQIALQAPSAHNTQRWHWIVVTDEEKRRAIADVYRKAWLQVTGGERRRGRRWKAASDENAEAERLQESVSWIPDHLHEVPALVIPCLVGPRYDNEVLRREWVKQMETAGRGAGLPGAPSKLFLDAGYFASIYPAVWQFQLALRAHGLGSCITITHLMHEQLVADILGLPPSVVQTCLLPVAYTTKRDFAPAARESLVHKVSYNGW